MDRLGSLSESQSASLQSFLSVTGSEDVAGAIAALESTHWNLERATQAALGGIDEDDPTDTTPLQQPSSSRPRRSSGPTRSFNAAGSGPTAWPWLRRVLNTPPFSILVWAISLIGAGLGMLARAFGFRPSTTFSWRSGGSGGLPADPYSCAERFVRGVEETSGQARENLPSFVIGSYSQALQMAKEQLRPLCVILVSGEHDDTPEFVKKVIADPDFVACLLSNDLVVYGGDVKDRDAYQTAQTLEATTFPFVGFISLTPPRNVPNTSTAPGKLSLLSRHEGSPRSVTSAPLLVQYINTSFIPRVNPYLSRLRQSRVQRDAERRLREDQDRAYAEAGRRDAERIRKKMAEEEAEKRRVAAEEQERADAELLLQCRSAWRAYARRHLVPVEPAQGARIAVKLPDGRRLVRRFAASDPLSMLYAWIECEAGGPVSTDPKHSTAPPARYQHEYRFKIAQMMPKRTLENTSDTLESVGNILPAANLVIESLKVDGAVDEDEEEDDE